MTRETLMTDIKKQFPDIRIHGTTEDFDGHEGGVWVSGEEGTDESTGLSLFDYYTEDMREIFYVMMVYKPLHDFLHACEWYAEFQDPGTVMLYPE